MAGHARDHHATAPAHRIEGHHGADSDEQGRRIGVGTPREARPDPIDHRIGADRHCGEQGEADGAAVKLRKVAPAAQRHEQHAGDQQNDPEPGQNAKPLADEHRRGGRRHQRGRAAGDRIDLPHIARAVAFDQGAEIEEMDQHRRDDERPCWRRRQADDRNKPKRDDRSADRDGDRHGERIEPALDGGVPGRMAGGGEQHGGEDERVH